MKRSSVRLHATAWLKGAPRGQFWIYFFAAIFFNFGFSVFFFLFNLYLLGFGFNERSLGFLGSAMAVGTLCGTLPVGIALQKCGLRATLLSAVSLACIASILRIVLVAHAAQIPLAVLSGFGLSAWGVCLSPTVASLTGKTERGTGFSIMFASGIGIAGLGALTAGNLPALLQRLHLAAGLGNSERYTLLAAVAVASFSLVPIARLNLPPAPPRLRLVRPTTPFLRTFLPAMAIWSLVTGALPPFASLFFVHHLGLSLEAMGGILSLSQLVQFAAIIVAPLLFSNTGFVNGIVLTQLSTAAMLFCLASARTSTSAGWLYWGYMAAQCMNEPGICGLLMDRVPAADRTGASSYTFFATAAAHIFASTVVGLLIVRVGYSVVLCGAASLAVLAAILFRGLARPKRAETSIELELALAED